MKINTATDAGQILLIVALMIDLWLKLHMIKMIPSLLVFNLYMSSFEFQEL